MCISLLLTIFSIHSKYLEFILRQISHEKCEHSIIAQQKKKLIIFFISVLGISTRNACAFDILPPSFIYSVYCRILCCFQINTPFRCRHSNVTSLLSKIYSYDCELYWIRVWKTFPSSSHMVFSCQFWSMAIFAANHRMVRHNPIFRASRWLPNAETWCNL